MEIAWSKHVVSINQTYQILCPVAALYKLEPSLKWDKNMVCNEVINI